MIGYIISLASLVVLDVVWLTFFMNSFYEKRLGYLMPEKVNLFVAVPFYLIFALAIMVFVVGPAQIGNPTLLTIFLKGALLGLAAYAAYDFTNLATVKGWSLSLTFVDLLWGAFMTGLVSVIVFFALK